MKKKYIIIFSALVIISSIGLSIDMQTFKEMLLTHKPNLNTTIATAEEPITITSSEITSNSITVKITSNNKEFTELTKTNYSYYIKETTQTNYPTTPIYEGTDEYKFNNLESGKTYDVKVTLTNKAGNLIQKELKNNTIVPENILVSNIVLNQTNVTMKKGDSLLLTATAYPTNANNKTVEWTSSNPSVVTVDNNGNVTAQAIGTATIIATAKDGSGVSASCYIAVELLTNLDIGRKANYVAKSYTDLIWRIYYYDENYVYLISEKANGTNTVESFSFQDIVQNDEKSSHDVDPNLRFLNQNWYDRLGNTPYYDTNTTAIAYLMDQSVWSGYKDNNGKAAYAIGTPTLELFSKSFEIITPSHPDAFQIQTTCNANAGYNTNYIPGGISLDYNNGIYHPNNSYGYWMASPIDTPMYGPIYAILNNYVDAFIARASVEKGDNSFGLRPLVLIPKANFNYTITD